ncbi:MAG TPA: lytic transglycosylase domain-containing protein [Stellaceae bacterium]|nr:lytic transglycosylase domain-containing protein [Stellaceae bacterium]
MGVIASLGILFRGCAWGIALAAAALCCGPSPAVAGDAPATGGALNAPSNQVETVSFADPRWPAVRVVRGAPKTAPTAVIRPSPPIPPPPVAAALPAVPPAPVFPATAVNTELVTFGDGRGARVQVVRGAGVEPPGAGSLATPQPGGRVEIVRFDDRGAPPVSIVRGAAPSDGIELFGAAQGGDLERVAFAVDGAESGHGGNLAMWRPELDGPQGPMQVSAAAALDVGGGDRFDMRQNRLMGRAYLAQLYQRYGNWPDAIAAYNWGPGNLDQWIAAGRPVARLPLETARYLLRVLHDALLLRPS